VWPGDELFAAIYILAVLHVTSHCVGVYEVDMQL
jgi:hypothetical protein